jgi:hypothetical protein
MGVACGVLHLDLCAARVQRCAGPLEGAHRQVHGCSFWRGLRTLQENELQLYGLLDLLQHERRAYYKAKRTERDSYRLHRDAMRLERTELKMIEQRVEHFVDGELERVEARRSRVVLVPAVRDQQVTLLLSRRQELGSVRASAGPGTLAQQCVIELQDCLQDFLES